MNPRVVIAVAVGMMCTFVLVLILAVSHDEPDASTGPRTFEGAVLPRGLKAPDFALHDQDGKRVTMRSLRGQPVLLSFLYTHCQDTCPTQAAQMRAALDDLGSDVPAVAITVDPSRDTQQSAKAFLAKQSATGRISFLLGSRAEVAPIWKAFAIKPQLKQFDHTARFVLIDKRGRQRVSFPLDQATPQGLAHDLRLLAHGV